ncbi:MAG TPA: SDR family oxidoreductase, partial [Steroidobacteraceae bacterium]
LWSRFDAMQDLSALEHVMRVNYFGSVWVTAAALPALKQSRGLIVAVASLAGLTGVPERTGYAASKHAMVGFFESLRIELAGTGVDVTIVAPDFVVSEIHRRALGPDGKPLGQTPMRESKIMTAEECARMIHRAMERRQRLLITSWRGRFGQFARLIVPGLVDRIAARAIRERH